MQNTINQGSIKADDLLSRLDLLILERFPVHPFSLGVNKENFFDLMSQYVAMSVAFPYIQAGAIHNSYRLSMQKHGKINNNVRTTAAVGAFLVWDEFGGHELVLSQGPEALPKLIQADHNFHSALLIQDVGNLMESNFEEVVPNDLTSKYLDRLLMGLSDPDSNNNVAHMLAFERHANAMITSLFDSIKRLFGANKAAQLPYFSAHVGCESKGEAVHVATTGAMIDNLIPESKETEFIERCLAAYELNYEWCSDLTKPIKQ